MVNPHLLMLFLVAGAALVVIPGPNLVYITARSVAEGRRAGVASALGVETGTLVHIAIAAAGLSYLIAASEPAFAVVRYTGAAYLIYLGIRTLRSKDEAFGSVGEKKRGGARRAYLEGVVVNVFNPKVILFFLAFLPQFVDPAAGPVPVQIVILGLLLLVMGIAVDMTYAFGAGALGNWFRRRPGAQKALRVSSGVIYLGLGALAAATGSRSRS